MPSAILNVPGDNPSDYHKDHTKKGDKNLNSVRESVLL